jgi:hypothetical protein
VLHLSIVPAVNLCDWPWNCKEYVTFFKIPWLPDYVLSVPV